MMEDDKIKKISKMLELGGTMLAQHCSKCGAPLFRYKGRILCPVCESEEESEEKKVEKREARVNSKSLGLWNASISLRQKFLELSEELEQEKDPRRMLELLKVMEKIIEVMRELNESG
ncbi:hypothetical protein DRN72_04345 [Methanosarcinales archaeon]|nr:MAG: hypothetical protein DRN72_04345 [Methanosarcinales archaeon]